MRSMDGMVGEGDWVAVFQSVHRVMKAEQVLKRAAVPMLLIPAPRELVSDCGLAIRFAPADRERLLGELAAAEVLPTELYCLVDGVFSAVGKP